MTLLSPRTLSLHTDRQTDRQKSCMVLKRRVHRMLKAGLGRFGLADGGYE